MSDLKKAMAHATRATEAGTEPSTWERVLAAMNEAEEIGGPDPLAYVALMVAISSEASRRAAAAFDASPGKKVIVHECPDRWEMEDLAAAIWVSRHASEAEIHAEILEATGRPVPEGNEDALEHLNVGEMLSVMKLLARTGSEPRLLKYR